MDDFLADPNNHKKINRVVSKYVREPKYYWFRIRKEFKMLMDTDNPAEWAYFVDPKTQKATPIREHNLFSGYINTHASQTFLFVVKEAHDAIEKLLQH